MAYTIGLRLVRKDVVVSDNGLRLWNVFSTREEATARCRHILDIVREIDGSYYLFYFHEELPSMYLCESGDAEQAAVTAGVRVIPVDEDGVRYEGYGVGLWNNERYFFVGYPADNRSPSRIFCYPLSGVPVPQWLRLRLPDYPKVQAVIARLIWAPMPHDEPIYTASSGIWQTLINEGERLLKRGAYGEMRVIVPVDWHLEYGWQSICFRAYSVSHLYNELLSNGVLSPERCRLFINLVGEPAWHYVRSLSEVMTHWDVVRQRRVTKEDTGCFRGNLGELWRSYVG